jgi:archaellum component FlaC
MNVTRPEWGGAANPGPETYAPLRQRTSESSNDGDRIAVLRSQTEASQSSERSADSLDGLIRRLAGASIDEIDYVIRELERVREMLRSEGERVSREIASYAELSRVSMSAIKTITENIKKMERR